ncbi:MAG: sialidase family protein, partial [Planctomycetota bacterium]
MMRTCAPLWLLSLALGPVWGQDHHVGRVSPPEARTAAEVSIAINPTNPDNLVAAAIMRGYQTHPRKPNYTFHSFDAGRSWKTVPTENPDNRTQGDDVVVFSREGSVVHGYICFIGTWGNGSRAANGIYTTVSDDGGITWAAPVPVVDHLNTGTPMEDKPWFVF